MSTAYQEDISSSVLRRMKKAVSTFHDSIPLSSTPFSRTRSGHAGRQGTIPANP